MPYLNFYEIKTFLTVEDALLFFEIKNLKFKNYYYSGACPLHKGSNPNAFHFCSRKKVYNCFTRCGDGNILKFIMKYKKISVYKAGLIALEIIR